MTELLKDVEAEARIFESAVGSHLFLTDGSRVFDLDDATAYALSAQIKQGKFPDEIAELIGTTDRARYIDAEPIAPPKLRSLSLNVAQSCNMSCSYCYADEGRFGGGARVMRDRVARHSVDRLIAEAPPESDLVIGFMGGEPFLNRKLIHSTVGYAREAARASGHRIRFSVTTNATLLNDGDVKLLVENPFTVTVSLDGDQRANDAQREMSNRSGSAYQRALDGLVRLTKGGRPRHLSVRATATPKTGRLSPLLDHLLSLDIDEAGFAPVIAAPPGAAAYAQDEMDGFLNEMLDCGEKAKAQLLAGHRYAFSNFETALHEIHRGTHRPYPCGAGAGYLSVNTEGALYACHRLVDDPDFLFGDVFAGSSQKKRQDHLAERHVDRQEPCRSCWARYLCGGGCYHEVERRGRIGCDYVRGWLDFCLSSYAEISRLAPAYFDDPHAYFETHEVRR